MVIFGKWLQFSEAFGSILGSKPVADYKAAYMSNWRTKVRTIIALAIGVCALCSVVSGQPWDGNGVEGDPYLIYDACDMQAIGADSNYWDAHFVLCADINLAAYTGKQFNIIGNRTTVFSGSFDGNDYRILYFTFDCSDQNDVAVFGRCRHAELRNIVLFQPSVSSQNGDNVGTLVGYFVSGDLINCRVENGTVSAHNYVGGLTGYNRGTLRNCSSIASVHGFQYIGGVTGCSTGSLENTFSNSQISGTAMAGGLVGYVLAGTVVNCYSQGSASGSIWVGGLVGYGRGISNCYAASIVSCSGISGGLVGDGSTLAYNSYWDTEVSGKDWSRAGKGRTTAEMQSLETYMGWVCHPVWSIDDGNDYPRLIWENLPGTPIDDVLADLLPGQGTEQEPFLVSTAQQLNSIGLFECDWGKHFRLISNVNLAECGTDNFNVIGIDFQRPFTGVFDSNAHSISNLQISEVKRSSIGLFGIIKGENAQIRNLILFDPNISIIGSCNYAGSVVGRVSSGTVSNCSVVGGSINGYDFVGGIVGSNGGEVVQSSHSGQCSGRRWVGGLVGSNNGSIYNSLAESFVHGGDVVGGLAGSSGHVILNSYSNGTVTGDSDVGGLVGANLGDVFDSYSSSFVDANNTVGGLVGSGSGSVYNSYWDVNTSSLHISAGGTGLTTQQLYDSNSFPYWGCDISWKMNDGNDYPRLYWEDVEGEVLGCESPWPGLGTPSDPYLIYSEQDLAALATVWYAWERDFRVMADLDLAALPSDDWNVIASSAAFAFSGVFDGNGHRISNLKCLTAKKGLAGLFGCLDGPAATIQDLVLINPNVSVSYGDGVGSLVGEVKSGKILRCAVLGAELTLTGEERTAGGLVGINSGEISECSANAVVLGTCGYICGSGGLVASNYGQVYDCYASGEITGGGLVGMNTGLVSNCYSTTVTVETGGLVELNYGEVLSSFWDVNSSGTTVSAGGTGLPIEQMQQLSTFTDAGWDFVGEVINGANDIWEICEGTNYPKFVWQELLGDFVCPDGVSLVDYSYIAAAWYSEDGDGNWDPNCDISDPNDNIIDERDLRVFVDNYLKGI